MTHFSVQRFARLVLYATLSNFALACGADSDHGPPIGSPTGPTGPVVGEAGNFNGAGTGGQFGNPSAGAPAVDPSGGSFNTGTAGGAAFGTGGSGNDPFGIGGSETGSDPFGIGGGAPGTPGASGGLGPF